MKLERWKLNLYTLWVTQIFSMVGFGLGVPFIPYYIQEMGVSDPGQLNFLVGLSSTLPAATMAVFSPIWGKVSDIYGRKMMLMRAMLCAALVLASYGFCRSAMLFMVLRAIHGIFTGTVGAALTFVSANTPKNRMSFALGFLSSSNFLGYAVGPVMGGFLAEAIGYRACFYIGAAVMFVGFLLVMVLLKEDKNSYGRRLIADTDQKGKANVKVMTKFTIAVLMILLFVRITRSLFPPFVPLFVQDRLGTMTGAATYTGLINGAVGVGTAIASVTIARLGDKYDKYKVTLLLTVAALFISILLLPHYSLILFTAVYALYFFMCGAVEPIMTSWASEKIEPERRGSLFGIIGTINSVAMMAAPMIGTAVTMKYPYSAILTLIPLFTAVQLVVLLLSRKTIRREA